MKNFASKLIWSFLVSVVSVDVAQGGFTHRGTPITSLRPVVFLADPTWGVLLPPFTYPTTQFAGSGSVVWTVSAGAEPQPSLPVFWESITPTSTCRGQAFLKSRVPGAQLSLDVKAGALFTPTSGSLFVESHFGMDGHLAPGDSLIYQLYVTVINEAGTSFIIKELLKIPSRSRAISS